MVRLSSALIATVLASASAMAQVQAPPSGMSFEQVKQRKLERIDRVRACIVKATNFEQMKACKPDHKNHPGT